jgi:hypothetical protein
MKLTVHQKRALEILLKHRKISAARFGELMWPDSPAARRMYNTGNGATRGKGLWLAAGSYLAKLRMRGWVRRDDGGYDISFEGMKELETGE